MNVKSLDAAKNNSNDNTTLRFILWKNGSIPWNYARFLKYADERKLINQVGGRFTFIHDKLQEHFAEIK